MITLIIKTEKMVLHKLACSERMSLTPMNTLKKKQQQINNKNR